jgi:hypothetical protein
MNTLFEKHIALIEAVNNSKTVEEHASNQLYLTAWRNGVRDAGDHINLTECSFFYYNQGITRPMTAGVWDDWEPSHK